MAFQFKGSPAASAGDAVSLAAEMGARNVSTTGADVEDETALRAEASRLAFADARMQADTLAQASGRRIIRVLRVQDANARLTDITSGEAGEIVVTGSRLRPSVAVPVDQPPIEVESRLTVVFEID
ncbi:MAG TPA: SIMPL domain-containing protein [Brevundimonas sp.]|nr:SIMPL domain-containing protein [Brevundimonas sp.]